MEGERDWLGRESFFLSFVFKSSRLSLFPFSRFHRKKTLKLFRLFFLSLQLERERERGMEALLPREVRQTLRHLGSRRSRAEFRCGKSKRESPVEWCRPEAMDKNRKNSLAFSSTSRLLLDLLLLLPLFSCTLKKNRSTPWTPSPSSSSPCASPPGLFLRAKPPCSKKTSGSGSSSPRAMPPRPHSRRRSHRCGPLRPRPARGRGWRPRPRAGPAESRVSWPPRCGGFAPR